MSDQRLTELTEAAPADDDWLYLVDVSDTTQSAEGTSRKVQAGRIGSRFNVKAYGATGDGSTDDTAAIKAAISAAHDQVISGNTGDWGVQSATSGSMPEVFFPSGLYKITGPLTDATTAKGQRYVHYRGENAVLVDTTETVTCFQDIAWDARFTQLKFRGFDTQIHIDTDNVNRAKIDIVDCEFTDPASYCIQTSTDSNSSLINVDRCRFSLDQAGAVTIDTSVDFFNVRSSWFQCNSTVGIITRNHLIMRDCVMVPSGTNTDARYWIENRGGRLYVEKMRFGGEGAGRAFLWHYTDTDSSGTINPVHVILKDFEAYATEELMRLYGLPNHLVIQNVMDDNPSGSASPVIWADTNITDAELKAWARYGSVDIDERWPRIRTTGHTEVAAMLQIKNLKTNPKFIGPSKRIPVAKVVGSGHHNTGWAKSSTTSDSSGDNGYGTTSQVCTANSDDDSVSLSDTNFLPEATLGRQIYTMCHEIEWQPAGDAGHCELFVDVGYERYQVNLLQGRHVYSFPFLYLNGGGGAADTDLDNIQYQTGARLANGDVITWHRWYLLEDLHLANFVALEMEGSAAPSSLGAIGPNQSFFVGDIVWEVAPAASGNIGNVCVAAGNPGTWKTFGTIAA